MTRHQGFDVRVAPDVLAALAGVPPGVPRTRIARAFAGAMDRLGHAGTHAAAAKKLKGLDLWEVRVEDRRVFFRPVARSNVIAVGFIATKRSRRLRMSRLKHIERAVRRWSDELEAGP
jgi:hypothetical protein